MAYKKQTFIDYPNEGYTLLNAEHLNHIEDGFDIAQVSQTVNSLSTETDLNTVGGNAVWLLDDASKYYNYPGSPVEGGKCVGFLFVNTVAGNWTIQRFYNFSSNATYYRRGEVGKSWSGWMSDSIDIETLKNDINKRFIEAKNADKFTEFESGSSDYNKATINLNTIYENGYYILDTRLKDILNCPENMSYRPTYLKVERCSSGSSNSFVKQTLGSVLQNVDTEYFRLCNNSGNWNTWRAISPRNGFNLDYPDDKKTTVDGKISVTLSDITEGGYYIIDTTWDVTDYPTDATYKPSILIVEKLTTTADTSFIKQTIGSCYSLVDTWYYRVTNSSGQWTSWKAITPISEAPLQSTGNSTERPMSQNAITTLGNSFPKNASKYLTAGSDGKSHIDLRNITEGGYYIIDTTWIADDLPDGVSQGYISGLHVERHYLNETGFVKQTAYSITGAGTTQYWRVSNVRGEWGNWTPIGSGSGDINNNTYNNEIVTNVYNNSYTVTANPTITTSTNDYLASTNNNADRTSDIIAMLEQTGTCRLGPGDFFVHNLHMPSFSTIVGSGHKTRVYLMPGIEDGYVIRLNEFCAVKDLCIIHPNDTTPSGNIGNTHGIVYQGTYNTDNSSDQGGKYMQLSNLYIEGFDGGGITCYNTGYSTSSSILANNIHIRNCNVGINISYWSEYHKFTNVDCNACYYGCINNGGNNMFVNCGFNSNKVGFVIDNSLGDKTNNAHGSAIGCTFNHQDGNNGYAIKVINSTPGYIFEGCQIFYGKTLIENSEGIVFIGCNFGSNEGIEINSGKTVLYNGCVFGTNPNITKTNNSYTRFANCYTRSGSTVTG